MKDLNGNRKSMFVTLGASNHTDKVREINDFYATDPIAIDKLVDAIQLPKKYGSVLVELDAYLSD